MKKPLVSFIVPVYNKSHALNSTLTSLLNQTGDFDSEFVFVDDASTDNSLQILKNISDSRIVIIENSHNRGPAVRLNQGAKIARGNFLQFVDADDVLCRGATDEMLRILQQESADVIYGKWCLTQKTAKNLLEERLAQNNSYIVSDKPLHYVLTHRQIVRMVALTTRACYDASGGCDERVFVQDESLSLRLAWKASRFVDFKGTVILVPRQNQNNLSYNKVQQHHDGFCVYRNALKDMEGIDEICRKRLYEKSISIAWKHYRRTMNGTLLSPIFFCYLLSKIGLLKFSEASLDKIYQLFDDYSNQIRRPG